MKNADKPKTPVVNLYAIYDRIAQRYFPPFVSDNNETAKRSFAQMSRNSESSFFQSPSDYELMQLGDFDPSDAQIDVLDRPLFIASAVEFVNPSQGSADQKVMDFVDA